MPNVEILQSLKNLAKRVSGSESLPRLDELTPNEMSVLQCFKNYRSLTTDHASVLSLVSPEEVAGGLQSLKEKGLLAGHTDEPSQTEIFRPTKNGRRIIRKIAKASRR